MSDDSIVYVSCTEAGYEVCRRLLAEDVPVDEIVSLGPEQAERNDVSGYYSFGSLADNHGIPTYYPETYGMDTDADLGHFRDLDADLLIVNGWQRLVPGEILRTVTRGALGLHGSAYGLPKGRGRSPMNWSLVEDLDRFLLSLILLDEGVDSGDIVTTTKYEITDHDDIRTLYYKLAVATTRMLFETLDPVLSGDHEVEAQTGEPTYYPKRTPDDGAINWHDTTRDVYNLVRAVAEPYPGAFTEADGQRVFVWDAVPFSDDLRYDADPGTIVEHFPTRGEFVVKTADGTLLVTDWEAPDWTPEAGVELRSFGEPDRVDRPDTHE
mgnify:CR=1 FL=1